MNNTSTFHALARIGSFDIPQTFILTKHFYSHKRNAICIYLFYLYSNKVKLFDLDQPFFNCFYFLFGKKLYKIYTITDLDKFTSKILFYKIHV